MAAGAAALATSSRLAAADDPEGSERRPQKADLLVFSEGEREGTVITPAHFTRDDPLLKAWPKDPKTGVIRNGSRLNEVLLVKLDPAELDDNTRSRSADGIVAYSAICSHAGCPITAWMKAATSDKEVFKCVCHNSEFDPRQNGQVVFGPATRRLAALPISATDTALTVAAGFVGKLGQQTG